MVDREPVEESVTCWSCRNEVEISAIGDRDGYCPICDAPIDLDEEPYTSPQPAPERDQVRSEHAEWSQATFGNVGPVGPLKHLSKEALEAAAEPADLSEWADMQFLLWDAQRRAGITDEQITQAMIKKLAVNKQREWPEPKDSEPRLHIKEQPAAVGPVTDAMAYAFHHALTDGPLGDDDVEDIKTGLRAAFANVTTYQPLPVVLKEHQIRELVNKLRDIAIEYHGTQQLREHIACVIRTAISAVAPPAPKSAVN
uniref:dATP/dGTP pyrophosphohydrolase domain-containing protein n=1 Tax=Klebsiella pneumoniae TaxID=573 RepID=UPI0035C75E42